MANDALPISFATFSPGGIREILGSGDLPGGREILGLGDLFGAPQKFARVTNLASGRTLDSSGTFAEGPLRDFIVDAIWPGFDLRAFGLCRRPR